MLHILTRAQLILLGIFVTACIAAFGYQMIVVWPMRACADRGGWWDAKDWQCATPMPIWVFTHHGGPNPILVPAARIKADADKATSAAPAAK